MLKYFIYATRDLAVLAILLGMLVAWLGGGYGRRGRWFAGVAALAGFIASAVYAVLRYTTKVIQNSGGNGMWNVWTFAASLGLLALFLLSQLPPIRRTRAGGLCGPVAGAGLIFTLCFYQLPSVLGYPFDFNLGGASVLSTAFIFRFVGLALGCVAGLVTYFAACRNAQSVRRGTLALLMAAELLVNGYVQVMKGLNVLMPKHAELRVKPLTGWVRYVTNHGGTFIYIAMAIAVVMPILLWAASFHVNEPYENSAQHRKIKAKWRRIRRWATALALCFVLVVVTLTWFTAIDNRVIELSPAEACELRDDACWVPLEQVSDGHLHRFEYNTPNGYTVRFIVIKKPNSSAYGVGLDACDICGETGYFERGGQVVCKKCDVVMNINTIGFKGGCNPIVIEYSVRDGYIIVPTASLIEYEKEFKK